VTGSSISTFHVLDLDLPRREILGGEEAAHLAHRAHQLLGDVAPVEAVVGGVDRRLPVGAGGERRGLGLDELLERRPQVGLPEDLSRPRRLARLAEMGEEDARRVGPLLELPLLPLDRVRELRLDRIARRELDRRGEHLGEGEPPVLGEHRHQPAGRPARRASPG